MPGLRGDKPGRHREALLSDSTYNSSEASGSGVAGAPSQTWRNQLDTEAVEAPGLVRPYDAGSPTAQPPAPAPARLALRPAGTTAHPLVPAAPLRAASPGPSFPQPASGPPCTSTTGGGLQTILTTPGVLPGSSTLNLPGSSSISGALVTLPPGAGPGPGPALAPSPVANCSSAAVINGMGTSCTRTPATTAPVTAAASTSNNVGQSSQQQLQLTSAGRSSSGNGSEWQNSLPRRSDSFAPECRICLLADPVTDLVAPCHCTGSLQYAHMGCLRTWVIEKRDVRCELCGTMYKEPYGSELAAAIPPAPPPHPPQMIRRLTTPDGQQIIIMPVGVGLGPGAIGPLLQHHQAVAAAAAAARGTAGGGGGGAAVLQAGMGMGMQDPRDLEPQPLCEWRNMWSYALILLLLLFAVIYVTVISKRGHQEPWMMTLWQVLLVVLPIYLVLRIAFDLYRHRLAQQLAAANAQAVALANAAADAAVAAAAGGHPHPGGAAGAAAALQALSGGVALPREVIITRAGNRVLVLQRAGP